MLEFEQIVFYTITEIFHHLLRGKTANFHHLQMHFEQDITANFKIRGFERPK